MSVLLLKIFVKNFVVVHVVKTGAICCGSEVLLLLYQEDGRFRGGVRPECVDFHHSVMLLLVFVQHWKIRNALRLEAERHYKLFIPNWLHQVGGVKYS